MPWVAQLQSAMKGADTVKSVLERVVGEVDHVVMLGAFEGVAGVQDLGCFGVSKRFSCGEVHWLKEETLHPTTSLQQRQNPGPETSFSPLRVSIVARGAPITAGRIVNPRPPEYGEPF